MRMKPEIIAHHLSAFNRDRRTWFERHTGVFWFFLGFGAGWMLNFLVVLMTLGEKP